MAEGGEWDIVTVDFGGLDLLGSHYENPDEAEFGSLVAKRGEKIYAIIETGGKQYRVAPRQTIEVERLHIPEGDTVELGKVLFISDNDSTLVGAPIVEGAKVIATSLGEVKGKKVIVFRYRPKVRYRRKTGHRQIYTRLSINEIVKPGE